MSKSLSLTFERSIGSLAETETMGRELAASLRGGDILRLEGDLGAGKTTLARALAAGLGADPRMVNSPTYVFMNEYPINQVDGAEGTHTSVRSIVHMDCYRMHGEDDLDSIGWDAVMGPTAVALVEWPERLGDRLEEFAPNRVGTVRLEHAGEDAGDEARRVTIEYPLYWAERGAHEVMQRNRRPDTTCPVSGVTVPGDSPTWPFANERLQMADLYKWFSGQHTISRPMEERDLEEGLD